MKISKNNHSKGFTLVELLVVLAIIATLAGISFPIINSVRNSGKKTETKIRMREFESAVTDFFNDTGSLPYAGTDYPSADKVLSGGELTKVLSILLNEDSNTNATNTVYLKMPRAKGKQNGITYGSSETTAVSIVDGWGKEYYIAMDYDLDGAINHPTGGDKIKGKKVIILSRGSDIDEKDDDVLSWE